MGGRLKKVDTQKLKIHRQQGRCSHGKIPQGRYTKEFCEKAARLVLEEGLLSGETAKRLS